MVLLVTLLDDCWLIVLGRYDIGAAGVGDCYGCYFG